MEKVANLYDFAEYPEWFLIGSILKDLNSALKEGDRKIKACKTKNLNIRSSKQDGGHDGSGTFNGH